MIDLPPNDYLCIEHNPHFVQEMTVTEYINEVDVLPSFMPEELHQILKEEDFWMVTYILDGHYYRVARLSLDRCIEYVNMRRRLGGLD